MSIWNKIALSYVQKHLFACLWTPCSLEHIHLHKKQINISCITKQSLFVCLRDSCNLKGLPWDLLNLHWNLCSLESVHLLMYGSVHACLCPQWVACWLARWLGCQLLRYLASSVRFRVSCRGFPFPWQYLHPPCGFWLHRGVSLAPETSFLIMEMFALQAGLLCAALHYFGNALLCLLACLLVCLLA